jgi:hypothetical protein
MKPFDYYSTPTAPYPRKSDYTTVFVYDHGRLLYTGVGEAGPNSITQLKEKFPGAVIQLCLDHEAFKEHRTQYERESNALHEEFRDDLFEFYGVTDNPKRFTCYTMAYERGHACGLSEVHGYFSNLVELIKE